jgi:hypothetical protein
MRLVYGLLAAPASRLQSVCILCVQSWPFLAVATGGVCCCCCRGSLWKI